jgi:hypothetical protein
MAVLKRATLGGGRKHNAGNCLGIRHARLCARNVLLLVIIVILPPRIQRSLVNRVLARLHFQKGPMNGVLSANGCGCAQNICRARKYRAPANQNGTSAVCDRWSGAS